MKLTTTTAAAAVAAVFTLEKKILLEHVYIKERISTQVKYVGYTRPEYFSGKVTTTIISTAAAATTLCY